MKNTAIIRARVSADEKACIEAAAARDTLTVSTWLPHVAWHSMRFRQAAFVVGFAVAGAAPTTVTAQRADSNFVATRRVRLRAAPSLTARSLRTLPVGTSVVRVRPDSVEGSFYHVVADRDSGCVSWRYLRASKGSTAPRDERAALSAASAVVSCPGVLPRRPYPD